MIIPIGRGLSFRGKLIAAGMLVQIAAMAILTWNSTDLINQYLRSQLQESAVRDRVLFNAALSAPMAQRDYATVDAILKESRVARGIMHVIVYDMNGRVVAHDGWPTGLPMPVLAAPQSIINGDGNTNSSTDGSRDSSRDSNADSTTRFDFSGPISIGGQDVGMLQFGLSGALIEETRKQLLQRTIAVGLAVLIIFSLLLGALSYWLTRPLVALTHASRAIHDGNYDIALNGAGQDEIGVLTKDFQHMATEVKRKIAAITDSEAEQRRYRQEAENRQRELDVERKKAEVANEAKSDFLAKMSHEIRTPMHGMLGLLDLIRNSPLSAAQAENLEIAQRSGDALLGIVDNILDFSTLQSGHAALDAIDYNPADTAADIVNLFKPQADAKGVALALVAEHLPARIIGDPQRMRQVITNLVGNAVKFTERGHVTLRLGVSLREYDDHRLRVADDQRLFIEVEDTGSGISKSMLQKIFDPFTQGDDSTRRRYGGTGLGLAISAELVKAMKGELSVNSTPGTGSVFYFEIPLNATADALADEEKSETESALPVFYAKVLLAEDNQVNQLLATAQLSRLGCHVQVAANGNEAVMHYRAGHYDIVLMDCHMPELDGYQAATAIRGWEAKIGAVRIPIIAVTASVAEGEPERCKAAGMDDYLSKPFNVKQIAAMLSKWLTVKV